MHIDSGVKLLNSREARWCPSATCTGIAIEGGLSNGIDLFHVPHMVHTPCVSNSQVPMKHHRAITETNGTQDGIGFPACFADGNTKKLVAPEANATNAGFCNQCTLSGGVVGAMRLVLPTAYDRDETRA